MKISLDHMWASPSTLHLRLVVRPNQGDWMRFHNLHIPIQEIPPVVVAQLFLAHDAILEGPQDGPGDDDEPLFVFGGDLS